MDKRLPFAGVCAQDIFGFLNLLIAKLVDLALVLSCVVLLVDLAYEIGIVPD